MKKIILLIAAVGVCVNLYAENLKPIAQKISDQKTKLNLLGSTQLFSISNSSNQRSSQLNSVVSNATVLEFNQSNTQSILNAKPENLNFRIPTRAGGTIELELFRSNFFTPDFRVVTSATNGQPVPYEGGVHYWGIIKGDNSSLAAISIFNDEVMGMISSSSIGNLVLGKLENDAQSRHILYNDKDLHATDVPHCATADEPGGYSKDMLRDGGNQTQSVNCIRLYWEVNYDIYTGKGSVTATTNYVTGVFNQSAILYNNDNIPVSLSQVFVWNTTSPYTGTSTSSLLSQFQTNVNSFNGDLGHLIGYAGGGGIAASTNGLCNSNTDYKQCYSGISSSYQNVPTFSWTVEVVTHEQGHLMGSRHTHDCAWNGNSTKIDSCGDYAGYASGNCSVGGGNQALPSGGGTIMSYCHLVGSVGINFSNGFGSQPRAAILNKYNAASCLTACVAGSCTAPTGTTTGTIGQTSAVFSWAAATGALSYNVHYRITGTTAWTTANTTSTSYTASSLTAGSTYEWQVQTVCSTGSSSFTASTTFTTLPATCNTPTGLSTTGITTSSAVANWTAVAGATSYNVRYRKTGTTAWTTVTATSTTYSITGLLASTTYEWQVRTVCSFGNSSYSTSTTFTTSAVATCNAPTGMSTGSITSTSAIFSWTAATGAVTYNVQYRKTGTTAWTTGSTASTSFTVSTLTSATSYEWQVQTICSAGSSSFTNSTTFSTLNITSCTAPAGLSTTNITSSSATLNWSTTLCDSFLLRYFVTSIPNTVYFKRVSPGTAVSTTVSGLIASTSYTWLIRTYCNSGQSGAYSSTKAFTTLAPSPQAETGNGETSMVNSGGAVQGIILYPNPAQDFLTVELSALENSDVTFSVYNMVGQKISMRNETVKEGINVITINTSSFDKGVYLFESEDNGVVQRQKFLISK